MTEETERLWSIAEVAEYFGLPTTTLYQWKHRGYGPPGKRIGRHVRYDPTAVRRWFDEQDTQPPTAR